jgi:hypothetical protein
MNCSQKKIAHSSNKEITMAITRKEYYKFSERGQKAVNAATKDSAYYAAGDTVQRNAEAAGIKDLSTAEFKKARKIIQPRIRADRKRTEARAIGIERREAKKTAAKRAAAAIGNSPAAKKAASKPAAKKTAVKVRVKTATNKKGKK